MCVLDKFLILVPCLGSNADLAQHRANYMLASV